MSLLSAWPALFCAVLVLAATAAPMALPQVAPLPVHLTWDASPYVPPEPPDRGWPLEPVPRILRDFAPPEHAWDPGHRGIDLAAQVGQDVLAPADGVIAFAGQVAGTPVVTIRHGAPDDPDALRTTYQPVTTDLAVGTLVHAGQVVGTIAEGPFHCDQPCLHWGLLAGRRYLDPVGLIEGPPRLLPWVPDGRP